MARRKKSLLKRMFGKQFNIWDVILLALLLIYPIVLIMRNGWGALFLDIAGYVYGGVIAVYLVSIIKRRAAK